MSSTRGKPTFSGKAYNARNITTTRANKKVTGNETADMIKMVKSPVVEKDVIPRNRSFPKTGYPEVYSEETKISDDQNNLKDSQQDVIIVKDDSPTPGEAGDSYESSSLLYQCIVCKINKFPNAAAYDKHLVSQHHTHMFQLQMVRNDFLEQFKRAGAKLATRAMEYELEQQNKHFPNSSTSSTNFTNCNYCQCTVLNQLMSTHNSLLQHRELMEFVRPLCCGIKFLNRRSYDSHRTTRKHILVKWELEKKFIVRVILESEREARKTSDSKDDSLNDETLLKSLSLPMPSYLKNVIEKMSNEPFVKNEKVEFCLACEVSVPTFRRNFHPSSSDHHENMAIFTTNFTVCHILPIIYTLNLKIKIYTKTFSLLLGGVVMSSQIKHTQSSNIHPFAHILDTSALIFSSCSIFTVYHIHIM